MPTGLFIHELAKGQPCVDFEAPRERSVKLLLFNHRREYHGLSHSSLIQKAYIVYELFRYTIYAFAFSVQEGPKLGVLALGEAIRLTRVLKQSHESVEKYSVFRYNRCIRGRIRAFSM